MEASHAQTQKMVKNNTMRSKRVDVRPNSSQRKIVAKQVEENKAIQDIRVTRTQKGERKDRVVPKSELQKSKDEKYLRSLRKKMKDIDILLERQKKGDELNPAQLVKIAKLPGLLSEMESFVAAAQSE